MEARSDRDVSVGHRLYWSPMFNVNAHHRMGRDTREGCVRAFGERSNHAAQLDSRRIYEILVFAGFNRGRWRIMVENAWLLTRSRCRRAPRANSFVSTKYDWSTWWSVATVCRLVRRPCWRSTALWPTLREPAIPSLRGKETLFPSSPTLPRVFCPLALPRPAWRFFSSFENKKKRQGLSRNFCVANLNDLCWFNLKQTGFVYIYIRKNLIFCSRLLVFHAMLGIKFNIVYCILEKTFLLSLLNFLLDIF